MKAGIKKIRNIFQTSTILVIVILVLVILRGPIQKVLNPIGSFFYDNTRDVVGWLDITHEYRTLTFEREHLQNEVASLQKNIVEYGALQEENRQLKEIVGFVDRTHQSVVVGKVVGVEHIVNIRSVVIDRGSQDGIHERDLVVNEYGQLVGKVTSLGKSNSHVQLITDPSVSFAVKKAGSSELLGISSGDFSTSLSVDLIPLELDVTKGDMLVTALLNNQQPDIFVGTVVSVELSTSGLFKKAHVIPAFDEQTLSFVGVIGTPTVQ